MDFRSYMLECYAEVIERGDEQVIMKVSFTRDNILQVAAQSLQKLAFKTGYAPSLGGIVFCYPKNGERIQGSGESGDINEGEFLIQAFCTLAFAACQNQRTVRILFQDDAKKKAGSGTFEQDGFDMSSGRCISRNLSISAEADILVAAEGFYTTLLDGLCADRAQLLAIIGEKQPTWDM
jgi:hypothetical protein